MSVPEDYIIRVGIFEKYAKRIYEANNMFHAAGIRKSMELDYGSMKQSEQILLEKDIARWMRTNAGIEFMGVVGRTHYYAFKDE